MARLSSVLTSELSKNKVNKTFSDHKWFSFSIQLIRRTKIQKTIPFCLTLGSKNYNKINNNLKIRTKQMFEKKTCASNRQ